MEVGPAEASPGESRCTGGGARRSRGAGTCNNGGVGEWEIEQGPREGGRRRPRALPPWMLGAVGRAPRWR